MKSSLSFSLSGGKDHLRGESWNSAKIIQDRGGERRGNGRGGRPAEEVQILQYISAKGKGEKKKKVAMGEGREGGENQETEPYLSAMRREEKGKSAGGRRREKKGKISPTTTTYYMKIYRYSHRRLREGGEKDLKKTHSCYNTIVVFFLFLGGQNPRKKKKREGEEPRAQAAPYIPSFLWAIPMDKKS